MADFMVIYIGTNIWETGVVHLVTFFSDTRKIKKGEVF